MVKNTYIYALTALIVAPMILSGCKQEIPDLTQDATLSVRIIDIDAETRASYGALDGKFEWNTGDRIALHYANGTFETPEVIVADDATDRSQGTVASFGHGASRDFYAIFPASVAVLPASGETAPKVKLPAEYDISSIVAGTSDLTDEYAPVPLVARNNADDNPLEFRHVGGLLQITCRGLKPATKKIAVTFDKDVTGTFTVDVTDPSLPTITTTGTTTRNTVTFTVASSAAGIGSGITKAVLNIPVPCAKYESVRVVSYDNAGNVLSSLTHTVPLTFDRHHGKRLASYTEVEYVLEGLRDASIGYTGGVAELASYFKSYKIDGITESGDPNELAVPFYFEYSATGAEGTWATTPPEWLVPGAGMEFGGSIEGQPVSMAVSASPNSVLDEYGIPTNAHRLALFNAPKKNNFDLSLVSPAIPDGSAGGWNNPSSKKNTANCYVVKAPGTYRIPVVYGNAIANNTTNQGAYRAKAGRAATTYRPQELTQIASSLDGYYLGSFVDHRDQYITTPYITTQLGTTLTAKLLWSDQPGLVEVTSATISGTGADAYLTFTVPQETICQGNAVIAVMAGNDIAWSWHIWVTDENLSIRKNICNGVQIADVSLGWVNTYVSEQYDAREYYIRAVQRDPDGITSSAVKLTEQAGPTRKIKAHGLSYQGGRKDPMPPSNIVTYPTREEGNQYYPVYNYPGRVTLGKAIRNPHVTYAYHSGEQGTWNTPAILNLWNSTRDGYTIGIPSSVTIGTHKEITLDDNHDNDDVMTKTVYDPTPVGFKVPRLRGYVGFVMEHTPSPLLPVNLVAGTRDEVSGYIYNGNVFLDTLSSGFIYWHGGGNPQGPTLRGFSAELGYISSYSFNSQVLRPSFD